MNLLEKIQESYDFIKTKTNSEPTIGIILGTGLSGLVDHIEIETTLNYSEIPNFPISTVESHLGHLVFGKIAGKQVVIMQGRMHYYEGYSLQEATFPIYVMKKMGVKTLFISNACGTVNSNIPLKSLMLITDHINMLGSNPLIGKNFDELGPRFPDMSEPYSHRLVKMAEEIALEEKIKIHKGVYAALSGPNLETRAEYRMLQIIGADVVGMSTVPENIVANYLGIEVFGLSIITDECYPDNLKPVELQDIIDAANHTEPNMTHLFVKMIEKL